MQKTIPDKVNWGLLTKKEGGSRCHESGPNNPACKTSNAYCSIDLGGPGDICYWHWCRMGSIGDIRCGCKQWKVVSGDSPGRMLCYRYYDIRDGPCIDMVNFYCCSTCQNCDCYVAKCGQMYVCEDCVGNHNESYLTNLKKYSNDDSDDDAMWPFAESFRIAFANRMANPGTYWEYISITKNGIRTTTKDPVYGVINIEDAKSAILASRLDPAKREWWEWIAGWYDDCPPMLTKWV